jgi:protein-S-isoprenylcysteine O-methyltransferase Ste14
LTATQFFVRFLTVLKRSFAMFALLAVLLCGVTVAFAAAAPSLHDVYEAADSGHVDQAQAMMTQVLRDHPGSAKAHYVAAEVDARAGHPVEARRELALAQSIDPTLSFVSASSVNALRAELVRNSAGRVATSGNSPRSAFPVGWILLLGGAALFLWFMFRRRAVQAPVGAQYPGAVAAAGGPYANPYGGPPGSFGGGGGLGSSLASGLAVGAGVVAGEEIARHFLDGDHRSTLAPPGLEESNAPPANGDMGGSDFGVSDAGSWDDGGGGFGGGGDDWS